MGLRQHEARTCTLSRLWSTTMTPPSPSFAIPYGPQRCTIVPARAKPRSRLQLDSLFTPKNTFQHCSLVRHACARKTWFLPGGGREKSAQSARHKEIHTSCETQRKTSCTAQTSTDFQAQNHTLQTHTCHRPRLFTLCVLCTAARWLFGWERLGFRCRTVGLKQTHALLIDDCDPSVHTAPDQPRVLKP